MKYVTLIAFAALAAVVQAQQKVTLTAEDDTEITADLYEAGPSAPVILLCHQAGSSRGEYRNIATRLVQLGYTCLAIDQRSGDEANGVANETHRFAENRKQPTEYIYSEQDIVAGIDYLHSEYDKPVIVLGSSYSASLALMIAVQHPEVRAVIGFSPGEYFEDLSVSSFIQLVSVPVMVTGAKGEIEEIKAVVSGIDPEKVTLFHPSQQGIHGARALDPEKCEHSEEYWKALEKFLEGLG